MVWQYPDLGEPEDDMMDEVPMDDDFDPDADFDEDPNVIDTDIGDADFDLDFSGVKIPTELDISSL